MTELPISETLDLITMLRANAAEPWATIGGKPFMLEAANAIEALQSKLTEVEAARDNLLNLTSSMRHTLRCQKEAAEDLLGRAEKAEADSAALRDVAKMVDAWGNGLRHLTAHESKMVKAARAALSHKDETP